jgi:hypothetical protein
MHKKNGSVTIARTTIAQMDNKCPEGRTYRTTGAKMIIAQKTIA